MSNISHALANFTAEPTPGNAVELAIADHQGASDMVDHEFISQLRKAARRLDLLNQYRDAKLLNELHRGDDFVSPPQSREYQQREDRALTLLLNS